MLIVPALDLYRGRCVRLFQGRYDQVTEYPGTPVEIATSYANAGVNLLHLVDLDGAQQQGKDNFSCISDLCAIANLRVQTGGGIRVEEDLRQRFELGVQRVVIGSLAVQQAPMVREWLQRYGRERIVLALDVRYDAARVPRIATHGWQQQSDTSLWQAMDYFRDDLQHVLCTDISRDGAMQGPSVDLYRECAHRYPDISFQASGGVRNIEDIITLTQTGAAAAITGKALLERELTLEEIRPFLQDV